MASVVKLPIAIEVLKQVAERKLTLDRAVWLGSRATSGRAARSSGAIQTAACLAQLRELLELAMVESDNTAADALLKLVGGPDVVERRLRAMGFRRSMSIDQKASCCSTWPASPTRRLQSNGRSSFSGVWSPKSIARR